MGYKKISSNNTNCLFLLEYLKNNKTITETIDNYDDDDAYVTKFINLSKWTNPGFEINCSNSSISQELKSLLIDLSQREVEAEEVVTYGKMAFTFVAILIILLTIWGNILVITAVCMERKLRKVGV